MKLKLKGDTSFSKGEHLVLRVENRDAVKGKVISSILVDWTPPDGKFHYIPTAIVVSRFKCSTPSIKVVEEIDVVS